MSLCADYSMMSALHFVYKIADNGLQARRKDVGQLMDGHHQGQGSVINNFISLKFSQAWQTNFAVSETF